MLLLAKVNEQLSVWRTEWQSAHFWHLQQNKSVLMFKRNLVAKLDTRWGTNWLRDRTSTNQAQSCCQNGRGYHNTCLEVGRFHASFNAAFQHFHCVLLLGNLFSLPKSTLGNLHSLWVSFTMFFTRICTNSLAKEIKCRRCNSTYLLPARSSSRLLKENRRLFRLLLVLKISDTANWSSSVNKVNEAHQNIHSKTTNTYTSLSFAFHDSIPIHDIKLQSYK